MSQIQSGVGIDWGHNELAVIPLEVYVQKTMSYIYVV